MKHSALPTLQPVQGWSDLGSLEHERPASCHFGVLAYMSRHRNAYWGNQSNLYDEAAAFDYEVRSLQSRAYRTNGTKWRVCELPAIVVNGSGSSALVIVEINAPTPFSETKLMRRPPESLADAARTFWPQEPNSIFRFQTKIGLMKPAELPLISTWSTRRNGKAAWAGEVSNIDISACVRLIARINLLLHKRPVGDSDVYRVVQHCA